MAENPKEKEIMWHSLGVATVFEKLLTQDNGLSRNEAQKRLLENGPNALPEGREPSLISIFFGQFKNPLIYVLICAAAVVSTIGEVTDGLIIFFVLTLNSIVGTIQEGKARKTLKSIKQFTRGTAVVSRDGIEMELPDEDLVVGDIIILRDGDKVPADARLISVQSFKVNESALTGESEPTEKNIEILDEKTSLPERKNIIFKGTLCVSGQAKAVVVSTGINTFIGGISEKLSNIDTEMPLKVKIRALSRMIGVAVFVAVVLMFVIGLARGIGLKEVFFTATAVSVSLIPEGLPVVITLILAKGVYRMAKRNALVKNMQAVEALGQANVIAVDKTGTITKNELMVERVYVDRKDFKVLGSGFSPEGNILLSEKIIDPVNHEELLLAGKIATFCANASVELLENGEIKVLGDPTEAALLMLGEKTGYKKEELESEEPKVLDAPFDFKHKFHTTLHKSSEGFTLSVVGAPESIFKQTHYIWDEGSVRTINDDDKQEIDKKIKEYSSEGLRILAFSFYKGVDSSIDIENMPQLIFGGLYAMADVLREEVASAVSEVRLSGIKTVMITGDFPGTAESIAREANIFIDGNRVLTGDMIEGRAPNDLANDLKNVAVFARVLPEHKLSIVEAYKLRGDIIGMTGDGVNDALSLQAAHLGIAMGKGGTEVAKEAADIVLLDNNFKSIIAAIEEGRSIYATIKKVVLYLISTSLGEFLSIAGAMVLGLPLPLFPSQILWMNLVTDGFMVVALGFEPNVSLKDGNNDTSLLPRKSFIRALLMSTTMMIGALTLFSVYMGTSKAWTVSLTVLVVYQWFNAWNVKSDRKTAFYKPFSNPFLLLGLFGATSFHLLAVYHPFLNKLLKTVPLALNDWLLIVLVASSIIIVEEVRKIIYKFIK